jgi:hypothetical protein
MKHKLSIVHCPLLFILLFALTGCKPHIDIQGTSSIPELEGRTLYLRVYRDGDLQAIDSASVTHGKFAFSGPEQDTTCMVFLFLDEQSVMPFVLERETPLTMTLDENENKVEGSALNDTLFAFIRRKTLLDEQIAALPRRESRMILDGYDHDDILRQLSHKLRDTTKKYLELCKDVESAVGSDTETVDESKHYGFENNERLAAVHDGQEA